jgi:integrase
MLAIVTGCRRGELGALTWADIDFKGRVLRISESLEQTKVGLRVKPTKTEKPRDIPLPKSAIELLREHRGRQPENRCLFGAAYRDDLNQESGTQWVKPSHAAPFAWQSITGGRCAPPGGKQTCLGYSSVYVAQQSTTTALSKDELAAADIWDTSIQKSIDAERSKVS